MNEQLRRIIDEYKKRTECNCCVVEVTEEIPDILDNKIGGVPYLPVGEKYPVDKNGEPMALLLQINCKDISVQDFPQTGILEIFAPATLTWPWTCIIRYYHENQKYQTDLPYINFKDFVCLRGYKINTKQGTAYMPTSDYRCDSLVEEITKQVTGKDIKGYFGLNDIFPQDDGKSASELFYDNVAGDYVTIGGYADFTQEDIRPREADGMDVCLFKLDSCVDMKKFDIGDAGILCVLIFEDDLKNCDFEKAFLAWDCY